MDTDQTTTPTPQLVPITNTTTSETGNKTTSTTAETGNTTNSTTNSAISLNSTNQTNAPVPMTTKVSFQASLSMSRALFTQELQGIYITGISIALSVPVSDLSIGKITEKNVELRRRAIDTSIDVETIAEVASESAKSVVSAVTSENINRQLASSGIEAREISVPVLLTELEKNIEFPTNTCGPGTYSSFDKTTCVTCPLGTFSAETGATSFSTCTLCPLSTHSYVIGAISSNTCTPCETGKFTARPGSIWIGQCITILSENTC
jgi:hypothetical protein